VSTEKPRCPLERKGSWGWLPEKRKFQVSEEMPCPQNGVKEGYEDWGRQKAGWRDKKVVWKAGRRAQRVGGLGLGEGKN